MREVEPYFRYWGKAGKEGDESTWHLLPYHCLDVAAVGWFLFDPKKPLCQRIAKRLQVEPEWLQSWFCFCLMLHDLGKFARAFQNLVPDMSADLVPYKGECVYNLRHDSLGFLLWKSRLGKTLAGEYLAAPIPKSWLEIVCGHHGQPPICKPQGWKQHFMLEDELAAESYVQYLVDWWQPDLAPLAQISKSELKAVSWQLAGAAVLADWLGSNQKIFPYQCEPMPLEHSWREVAVVKAPQAVKLCQWAAQGVEPYHGIQQQFSFIQQPTPLQIYGAEQQLAAGPQLFILEDVTGAGKTEAAMVLAHRLMAANQAKGIYVALPTMATSNAMYKRLSKSYRALFRSEYSPSLVLAHGAAKLSDQFVSTIAIGQQADDASYEKDEQSASAYCNAWLADSHKKALLADVGVGTIDQALLGVLPARHQSLRLLGLSDKVLLVDEVHAYDPYMSRLLVALLEAHARQGGSVILLSATLPQALRKQLLDGFALGLGLESPYIQKTGYPLASHFSAANGVDEQVVETREQVRRHVGVVRLDDEAQAMALIRQSVSEGQCICWIRNTVKDARSSFEQLAHEPWMAPEKITLFHSRFAMVDRQRIENDVLARFGKKSQGSQRHGQVLIATQVVEQSLDLDFDLLISDLAPVDLLIQRAGRLQRHIRDKRGKRLEKEGELDQRPSPCLHILSPDPNIVDNANWLSACLPNTQYVYRHIGQLWLSVTELLKEGGFNMPGDARRLIEGVYSEAAQVQIPDTLLDASWQAEGERRSQKGMGEFNRLLLGKGYTINSAERSGGWTEDVHIPTRLSAKSVTVVLAKAVAGVLVPYADVEEHAWAMSQLSLPKHDWDAVSKRIPSKWLHSIEQLKEAESTLKWCEVLPLVDDIESVYHPDGGWDLDRREKG